MRAPTPTPLSNLSGLTTSWQSPSRQQGISGPTARTPRVPLIYSLFSAGPQPAPICGPQTHVMLLTRHPHRDEVQPFAGSAGSRLPVAEVFVADGLSSLVTSLKPLLDPSFRMQIGQPAADGVIALLCPHGTSAIAYWRCKFPASVLIVIATPAQAPDAAAYLDAGADHFVTDAAPQVLAAYITAAASRVGSLRVR